MNQADLRKLPRPNTFSVGLPWLQQMFQYGGTPGEIPHGAQITITGPPGVGKTRFGLQLLDAIAAANPELNTAFHSFESTGPEVADLTEDLQIKNICSYQVNRNNVTFINDTVFLIDSADFWAQHVYSSPWPTSEMARYLDTAGRAGITVILIHHTVKSGTRLSGASDFLKLNDVTIRLQQTDDTGVTADSSTKNRWCGENPTIKLIHTGTGLKPAPPAPTFADVTQNMFSTFTNLFKR